MKFSNTYKQIIKYNYFEKVYFKRSINIYFANHKLVHFLFYDYVVCGHFPDKPWIR